MKERIVCGVRAKVADSLWTRFIGLMGKADLADGEGLLIEDCNAIHTHFMRFAIDAVFLDADERPVKIVRGIPPWKFCVWGGRSAKKVLETKSRANPAAPDGV